MGLEDKVLELLKHAEPTYDQLRAQLGARSHELDQALASLDRSRMIKRAFGRIQLNGSPEHEPAIAEAIEAKEDSVSDETKVCKACGKRKPVTDYYTGAARCKRCVLDAQAAAKAAKTGKPVVARRKRSAPTNGAKRASPATITTATWPLGILHFADGVRIGPMHASLSGIMQFRSFIDLSAAQLEELLGWWNAAKENSHA